MQTLITPSYGNNLVILFVQDKQKDNSVLSRVNQILLVVVVWKRLLVLPSFDNVTILLGLPSDLAKPIGGAGDPGSYSWVGKIPWRRKWQPTPVLLPGKFHGPRSLAGYSPWGHTVGHD